MIEGNYLAIFADIVIAAILKRIHSMFTIVNTLETRNHASVDDLKTALIML